MSYKVLFKIAAEDPHCGRCNHKLRTGIGVRVVDEESGRISHLGPSCLKKETGILASRVPVVSAGALTDEDPAGSGRDEASQAGKSGGRRKKDGDSGNDLREEFAGAAKDPLAARRLQAQANVWLRGQLLPEKGFSRLSPARFAPYLARVDSLTEDDIEAVETMVAAPGQTSLETLQHCMLVAVHLDHMLKSRGVWKGYTPFLTDLRQSLTRFHGLTDGQMEAAEKITLRHKKAGIPNRIENIRFPRNEERHQASLSDRFRAAGANETRSDVRPHADKAADTGVDKGAEKTADKAADRPAPYVKPVQLKLF